MHGLTPCPSGDNVSHFWMHGSHPAPFLNLLTLLAQIVPFLDSLTPPCPDFGHANPFWLRCVPFLDAPTASCSFMPVFGLPDPFWLRHVPVLDAPTPPSPFCPDF